MAIQVFFHYSVLLVSDIVKSMLLAPDIVISEILAPELYFYQCDAGS